MTIDGGERGQEASAEETGLLKLARDGDEDAFAALADAYRGELRAHCYRVLGSVSDADDALQEALLRAWRGLPGFEGRSSVRSWLYAIATNAALDISRHRSRRELATDFAAASAGTSPGPPLIDRPWLELYPDSWLGEDVRLSPEARYEQRESVELAFVIALQYLPPLQRAVLLLREVVGFSTEEISSQLGTSGPAVNSALQRARAAVRDRLPARSQQSTLRLLGDHRTAAIVSRYATAIERGDTDTLVSMLTQDATWSMPPMPTWFTGIPAIRQFLVGNPLTLRWKHLPARANGQLAVGCYLFREDRGAFVPAVVDVLTLDGDKIAAVAGFHSADGLGVPPGPWIGGAELFGRFGLPASAP
jgi:RNA polymerase sigma-70 factor (ECF subfamily)